MTANRLSNDKEIGIVRTWKQRIPERLQLLASFSSEPVLQKLKIAPSKLSDSGFRAVGNDGATECPVCGLKVDNWTASDDPFRLHQMKSPTCPIVVDIVRRTSHQHSSHQPHNHGSNEECTTDSAHAHHRNPKIEGLLGGNGSEKSFTRKVFGDKDNPDVMDTRVAGKFGTDTLMGNTYELDQYKHFTDEELEAEIFRLNRVNEFMKDEDLCKICMDNNIEVVILKCGHYVCCSSCVASVHNCPVCRNPIRGTVRVMPSK